MYKTVMAYLDKDLEQANALLERALAINPSEASAWAWSTGVHAWRGDGEEAVRRSHRAMDLSPFDPRMYNFTSLAAAAHIVAGGYESAIELCRRSS